MNKNTAQLLERHFDTAFVAPDGIAKLRELILTLAMQGKLVEQNPKDPPASKLLKEIEVEKQRLVKAGKIKKPKPLPPIKPEEVPYELPRGWEWGRLGDICSYIQRGKGPKYADISTHRVISQKCVRWYGIDLEPARYIDPDSLNKYEPIRFLRVGDLLWNSTGTGTIGRACLVPQEFKNIEIVADSHVTVVRPIDVSPLFLWRWIQSPIVQNEIEGSASGTTNQIELNTSTVINHLIPLAPLREQHRIVARIDQLMACCDELEKLRTERGQQRLAVHAAAIQQLLDEPDGTAWNFIQQHFSELYTVKENVDELRKTIIQLAVMGRLVPQDPKDPPASELLKEIDAEKQRLVKASKMKKPKPLPPITPEGMPYELPQGWEWVRLGEVVSLLGDGIHGTPTYDESGDFYFINGNNLSDGVIEIKENTKRVSLAQYKKHRKELTDRTVLVSINGTIGNVAFYNGEQVMLGKSACYFNLFPQIEKHYVKKLINSSYFLDYAFQSATGTTIKNVSLKSMREFFVPLPSLPEQRRIIARIDQLMALCDTLEQQIDAASGKQAELLGAIMAQV